ncbi:MAG: RNA-binding protein [Alphaproteobacteria bacterium]
MPRRNEPTDRMCIVTREVLPIAELFRFVADPNGEVVLDLRHRLPGRGVWVSARADRVRQAVKKKLFARSLKASVRAAPDLDKNVDAQLRQALLGALSLARKAGGLVTGFDSVEAAISGGRVAALIHAAGAGEDGIAKLRSALRRHGGDRKRVPVLQQLSEPELSLALGRPHVIHAALLAGRAGRLALDLFDQFARFHDESLDGEHSQLILEADQTAEHQNT